LRAALLGRNNGKVIEVDIEVRAHNKRTIMEHAMASRIELIEGSSIAEKTIAQVQSRVPPNASVIIVLDSNHSHDHVIAELERYAPLVTPRQFLVVADTILSFIPSEQTPAIIRKFSPLGNDFIRQ
jgi:cephalosporin hydroxylase